jgi:hypothetical protein
MPEETRSFDLERAEAVTEIIAQGLQVLGIKTTSTGQDCHEIPRNDVLLQVVPKLKIGKSQAYYDPGHQIIGFKDKATLDYYQQFWGLNLPT